MWPSELFKILIVRTVHFINRRTLGHTKQEKKGHSQKTMSLKYCTVRSEPRKFGISFTVPDRVIAEICDKKRVMGKHPLRISRIPSGGPSEFHKLVVEAEKESSPLTLKKKNGISKKLNHKKAYHRSRLNDFYVEVFYFETSKPN